MYGSVPTPLIIPMLSAQFYVIMKRITIIKKSQHKIIFLQLDNNYGQKLVQLIDIIEIIALKLPAT